MPTRRRTITTLAAAFASAGCVGQSRRLSFPLIERATLVRVRIEGQGTEELGWSAGVVGEITETTRIEGLLAFVNARKDDYYVPMAGAPVPEVRAEIIDGDELQSLFSSGPNFFQRATFWTRRASFAEVLEFLGLVGVDSARLRFPPHA